MFGLGVGRARLAFIRLEAAVYIVLRRRGADAHRVYVKTDATREVENDDPRG